MEVKTFELRDRATFISILCIKLIARDPRDAYLLARAGFGNLNAGHVAIQLVSFNKQKSEYDPYAWCDRTYTTAHQYIRDHWDELQNGEVVDVRYLLGETNMPCQSEQYIEL